MPELAGPAVPPGSLAARRQPSFRVDELSVRPWAQADVSDLVTAYADPGIQRWHVRSMDAPEAREWIRSWTVRWAAESGADWAVDDSTGLVGRVGLSRLDLAAGAAEASYWVVPTARRRHVATRALSAVSAWALGTAGLQRLAITHSVHNQASCRVAVSAGFAYEGTMRQHGLHADGWHDMHLHARTRSDA